MGSLFFGNEAAREALAEIRPGESRFRRHDQEEQALMRNLLVVAAFAATIITPLAARAEDVYTTGVVRGPAVVVDDNVGGIAIEQRPAFRQYVVRERVPNYVMPDRVVVGGVLPEAGVVYYDVPQSFGATPYRYTVVNGETVLVEPRSRRIVQVIE